jgi:hypothetical protein
MEEEPLGPLERPSPQAALLLLVPAALCSGLFYLWLGKPGESIAYGCLLGAGLAAVVLEFVKYGRWLRENPGARDRSATGTVLNLALQAFRLGFMRTAVELGRELFKLIGIKIIASAIFAAVVFFIARAEHWF